jgi:hypothetical protein
MGTRRGKIFVSRFGGGASEKSHDRILYLVWVLLIGLCSLNRTTALRVAKPCCSYSQKISFSRGGNIEHQCNLTGDL